MFKLHSNSQHKNRPSRRRSRIRAGVLGAGALGAGLAGTLGAGVASADKHSDTTTVTHTGTALPFGHTVQMPNLSCPTSHPYVLNQRYNTNTSFRLDPGIEFTNWSWGFDAIVYNSYYRRVLNRYYNQHGFLRTRWIMTGIHGSEGHLANATYWNFIPDKSNWTLTLHCTNNLDKARIEDLSGS